MHTANRTVNYRPDCRVKVTEDEISLMGAFTHNGLSKVSTDTLRNARFIKGQTGRIIDKMKVRDNVFLILEFNFYGHIVKSIIPEKCVEYMG